MSIPPANDSLGHLGHAGYMLGAILISLLQISKAWLHSRGVQGKLILGAVLCTARRRANMEAGSLVLERARDNKGLDSDIDTGIRGGAARSQRKTQQ